MDAVPIAQLRYVKMTGLWSSLWRDRHLKFHTYDRVPPSANVEQAFACLAGRA